MTTTRRIIHPTDFSEAAEPAFRYALDAAKRDDAELVLVHVLEPISDFADEVYILRAEKLREAARDSARWHFEKLVESAKDAGVRVSPLLLEGSPAEEIASAASTTGAHLIVMGTHGRTGLSRLVLGSVAQHVIALAGCPVVVVKLR
jgi:nucleotide-binding universal stress UspA family protein